MILTLNGYADMSYTEKRSVVQIQAREIHRALWQLICLGFCVYSSVFAMGFVVVSTNYSTYTDFFVLLMLLLTIPFVGYVWHIQTKIFTLRDKTLRSYLSHATTPLSSSTAPYTQTN